MASTYISLPFNALAIDNITVSSEPIQIAPDQKVGLVGENQYWFDEVSDVAPNATDTIVTYVFATEHKLRKVSATGNCIGVYSVKFDTDVVDKKRSTITDFNCEFDYETGITIPAGTTVSVVVQNSSTNGTGQFSARLLFSLK